MGAMDVAVFDDLLTANQAFSVSFTSGDLAMPPARQVAILTCMDGRLHPEKFQAASSATRT